eukprot:UN00699
MAGQESMDVDVNDVTSEQSKRGECMDTATTIQVSTIGILPKNRNLLLFTPQKTQKLMIRRPRSTLKKARTNNCKRLLLNPIAQSPNNTSTSSNHSIKSNCSGKSRIKRPRLSISRPSKAVNKRNQTNNKRLSLSSISEYNMITLTRNGVLFDSVSAKSVESQQTANSKISFISSQSSNQSSSFNISNTQHDINHDKIKKIKFENAKIHLQIDKLRLEKMYYAQILKSITDIVIKTQ